MSATATKSEVSDVVTALGLKKSPTILAASPIQSHIKFSMIRRPSNNYGLDGYIGKDGKRKPGLMDLLLRIYLNRFLDDLKSGRKPKRCIIFCRGNGILGALYSRLMELTDFKYNTCEDAPFVINHASLLPTTERVLEERADEIFLYLSSNKMLLGIDLNAVDFVIFLWPYNQPAALIQGGGRGGRKLMNGKRRTVQVYQLFNSQDFTAQNRLMNPGMKHICQSLECTRGLLKEYFIGDYRNQPQSDAMKGNCCHNCDSRGVTI